MIQNGRFWLLDEPTASLDARSERLVVQGLENQINNRTALMVTHQLNPLRSVDQIIVMQNGIVVQSGDFAYLESKTGVFQDMLFANQTMQATTRGNLDA